VNADYGALRDVRWRPKRFSHAQRATIKRDETSEIRITVE